MANKKLGFLKTHLLSTLKSNFYAKKGQKKYKVTFEAYYILDIESRIHCDVSWKLSKLIVKNVSRKQTDENCYQSSHIQPCSGRPDKYNI